MAATSAGLGQRLAQAQAGDGAAFASLVDPEAGRLLLYLRRRAGAVVGGDCSAEDLLQQTLLRAWQALGSFSPQGPDSIYRWLVTIARGIASDRLKYQQAKGRGEVRHIESWGDSRGPGPEPYDPRTSVTQLVERLEAFERVEGLLDRLDEVTRRVVEGHLLEGRSLSELAAEVGLSKSAVWKRLHSGLTQLRTRLSEASA